MHRLSGVLILIAALTLPGCQPSQSPPTSVLDLIGGRAAQWHTVLSRDAWARSRNPVSVPNDSLSFVGVSKAYSPGRRHDLYYVAIPGPSETLGRTLCEATAEISDVREVPGFRPSERVLVTETWHPDTCGWELEGDQYQIVYALSENGRTLHLWLPTDDLPADVATIPGSAGSNGTSMAICDDPTIALTGQLSTGHPPAVCAPEALFGDAGFRRTDVPFWSED